MWKQPPINLPETWFDSASLLERRVLCTHYPNSGAIDHNIHSFTWWWKGIAGQTLYKMILAKNTPSMDTIKCIDGHVVGD